MHTFTSCLFTATDEQADPFQTLIWSCALAPLTATAYTHDLHNGEIEQMLLYVENNYNRSTDESVGAIPPHLPTLNNPAAIMCLVDSCFFVLSLQDNDMRRKPLSLLLLAVPASLLITR